MSWLAAATAPVLPAWAVVTAVHPRLRADLGPRWGLSVPPVAPGAVWVHAASLGEVGAAEALVAHLDGPVLLTSDTETGAARARAGAASSGGRVVAGVRPVDHPWVLAPLWAQARPRAVVFVEGVWWPGLARCARSAGVPVLRVSFRAGPGTRRWARVFPYRWFAGGADHVVAQDADHAAWLGEQGLPAVVGGDLKGDRPLPDSPLRWERPFVAGLSTRSGDEAALLAARSYLGEHALLLAPRHLDRLPEVVALLTGLAWVRRTDLADGRVPAWADVVLLDTLGELAGAVRGARAAFVGGTFDARIGGHSPAEAARAGVPVVVGPHTRASSGLLAELPHRRADTPEALGPLLAEAVRDTVAPWSSGAAARTAEIIAPFLRDPAPEACPRPWARPLVPLFLAGQARRLRQTGHAVGVPVVSVGSTSARGSGKTATARWLARQLAVRGHRVGVALRGYGRGTRGLVLSTSGGGALRLGDEGALHARDGHTVAASADRAEAAEALVDAGCTVVVLDDGLQARELHRDLDLAVVDARFPGARGPFPAGERREAEAIPWRVDGVVVHHGTLDARVPVAHARRAPGAWHRGSAESLPPEGPVAALAGVGDPAEFFAGLGLTAARTLVLPDHGRVSAARLRSWADGLPVVCTAKDAARLGYPEHVWWRDVLLEVTDAPERWLEW